MRSLSLDTLLAFILPGATDIWLALLVGAALAPTDAALGAGFPEGKPARPQWLGTSGVIQWCMATSRAA